MDSEPAQSRSLTKKKKQFYINNIPNQSNQLNQLIPSTSIDQSFT